MRTIIIFVSAILILFSSSCVVAYAFAMRDKIIYKKEWKQENYKIEISTKKGGFGPAYSVCRVFIKNYFFYKEIAEKYFSMQKDVTYDGNLNIIQNGYRFRINLIKYELSTF